ncbi:MAG: hypothetical protein H6R17_522 [Proteobacteria bacterium]|nr:hypothetical protein [Pseudomonadota bacterium]
MPSTSSESPKLNRILAALGSKEYARIVDDLEIVALERGHILYEPGDTPDYAYFPTTCIVSRIYTTANGSLAEWSMTGNEGIVGVSLILGGDSTFYRVDVQNPGNAYRLRAEVMRRELDQKGTLQRVALWYTQFLMAQMARNVFCTRYHSVDQQVCRWLLLYLDRVAGTQIKITQERISKMLGVRREGVTEVAVKLQAAGLILYSRGHITIIDRAGLEARTCECYAAAKQEQEHLFRRAPAARVKDRAWPNPATLRRRAEARLRRASSTNHDIGFDSNRRLHELQVHQIELEIQKEELLGAYSEADALRERYADIYDFSPASYFTLDRQGTILDLNLAGAILLNIKRSQKNHYRFATSVSPEYEDTFKHFIGDVLNKKKGTKRCEITLRATEHRPEAIVRIEAVTDEDMLECRMVVIDISSEKRIEKALIDRNEYLRALIDNLPSNVWLKDDISRYLAVNKTLAQELGRPSADDLVGKTDFDIGSPEQAERYRAEDQAALISDQSSNGEQITKVHRHDRGFEIYKSPPAINGQSVGTVGFARDMTERHREQQALSESESQQRSFMENLPLSVTITQDGILKYINQKAAELFGYSPDECIGKSFLSLVLEGDRRQSLADHGQRMRGEAAPLESDLRIVTQSGQVIDCHCYFNQVTWNGHVASLGIFEDVTAQKRLQAELQSLESVDLLTRLANRQHFIVRMEEALSQIRRRNDRQVAVLVIELEQITEIDKTMDYSAGDAVLQQFSTLLSGELRTADTGGRIGDKEFAVLLPDTSLLTASLFAERLYKKTSEVMVLVENRTVSIAVKIGISTLNAEDTSAELILARANHNVFDTRVAPFSASQAVAGRKASKANP